MVVLNANSCEQSQSLIASECADDINGAEYEQARMSCTEFL